MEIYVRTSHKSVKSFYETDPQDFRQLLTETSQRVGWQFDAENGVFFNEFDVPRGYWIAANGEDVATRIDNGASTQNTIFKSGEEIVLYQDGKEVSKAPIQEKKELVELLNQFYNHKSPALAQFEDAIEDFRERIPELGQQLASYIEAAKKENPRFKTAYESFYGMCKGALYNKLAEDAVDEMLIQQVLGGRLVGLLDAKFLTTNPIAREIDKPLKYLDTKEFDKAIDPFHKAVEAISTQKEDFEERLAFVISIYEQFFQGFLIKPAELRPTPETVLTFMCGAVSEILKDQLELTLGDDAVVILDPATTTGEFVVSLLKLIPKEHLQKVYKQRLFANEMLLFPYYFGVLNINHHYEEIMGQSETFEGVSFADTLDLKKRQQMLLPLFVEENESRTHRQQDAPITVIIGNINSYAGKISEHNKRRRYRAMKSDPTDGIDDRIENTYGKNVPTTKGLYDTATRFFRWATDRLEDRSGVICFLSDHDFLSGAGFAGMRKYLSQDFAHIYHIDFDDNAFDESERGQGITILVKDGSKGETAVIRYAAIEADDLRLPFKKIKWSEIRQSKTNAWHLHLPLRDYENFPLIASEEARDKKSMDVEVIFKSFGRGVATRRDPVVYGFHKHNVEQRVRQFIKDYNAEVKRLEENEEAELDNEKLLWSANLRKAAKLSERLEYNPDHIRTALYRPFTQKYLYFSPFLNEDRGEFADAFPDPDSHNLAICYSFSDKLPWGVLMVNQVADVNLFNAAPYVFPFYRKGEENITDWALEFVRSYYHNETITKWDIFYYIYAILNHPGFRVKFEEHLQKGLPHIPLTDDFMPFVKAGRKLSDLHVGYKEVEPHKMTERVAKDAEVSYEVEKMHLNKSGTIKVNKTLTLQRLPQDAFDFEIGGRSAVEWVLDQYQVNTDQRSGITHDPNMTSNKRYIVDLVGKVIEISVETSKIIAGMPPLW